LFDNFGNLTISRRRSRCEAIPMSEAGLGVSPMFSCVSVWLEEWAPDFTAFLHALEWAVRLRLPLRAVRSPGGSGNGDLSPINWPTKNRESWPPLRLPDLSEGCNPETLPEICRLNHVEWTIVDNRKVQPDRGLCVIGASLPGTFRAALVRRAMEGQSTSLICAPEWTPLQRPMLVNYAAIRSDHDFLHRASAVCGLLRATPVVLTIAPTETDAHRNQQIAKEIIAEEGLLAQFDYAAHCDLDAVVELEANCRRCTHVFVPGGLPDSRRRRMRNDLMLPRTGSPLSLSFLILGTDNAAGEFGSLADASREAGFSLS
jgi:hypothetical protein